MEHFHFCCVDDSSVYMNEFELIKRITKGLPRSGGGLVQGVDDDCAVVEGPNGSCWLVTTDIFAEGIHFERCWADWNTLGEKALLVNISDIAAMGGTPCFYFASIGIPDDVSEGDILELNSGMRSVAEVNDMILAGGDTTSSKSGLFISITVVGSIEKNRVVYRRGAGKGDNIYVSGALGGSAAGLACLKRGLRVEGYSGLISKHLLPEPRLELAHLISDEGFATSMIDISDGLVGDLNHIAESSGVGYRIYAEKIPVYNGVDGFAVDVGIGLWDLVLTGGEEYELLFTVDSKKEDIFLDIISKTNVGCNATCIGEIIGNKGTRKVIDGSGKDIALSGSGFVHDIGSIPPYR